MKTLIVFFVALLAASITTNAQNLIAVQKGGAPAFYTDLPTAINNSVAGDTLYIPGGGYPSISINKKLYLIGVGSNPDSTKVTARTAILQISLTAGADNGSVTGVTSQNYINISGSINGYNVSRCNLGGIQQNGGTSNNFTITECILGAIVLNGSGHVLNNNILTNVSALNNSKIRNNIFLLPAIQGTFPLNSSNCIIENNIFGPASTEYPVNGNGDDVFNNNVNGDDADNTGGNGITPLGQGGGNFDGITTLQSIFLAYDPTTINGNPDAIYTNNFSLPAGSPYKNGGTDGTDVGIYGGAFPWKPGSIPFNPHFQSINIAPKTDASGNLKVQITVAAQNN